ncbi:MAG TPA: LysR family transcriptional regulator [Sphingobium sp.]|uniref:LysR family transcriptional regulator n=1 Tax=Sphingobium sp. TaxID=1912891 RepID=UPI002ED4A4F0
MDNFGQIKVFIQAAEARNFTLAGRTLGISSSGVGKAIARLEDRVGVRLFHRSTRSIALTPEGTRFLERCQRILSELELAENELSETQQAPRGKLHVSLPLVGMLMMPVLTRFMRIYPLIELDLDFTDRLVDLIHEGFDVVVRTGEVTDASLTTRTLGYFRHRIVGASAYLDRRGEPLSPADLAYHDCLHHKFPGTGKLVPWRLWRDGKDYPVALPRAVVASTLEPLVYMAEEGLGLACLPDYAVHTQLEQGRLRSVLDDYMHQEGVFRAVWPRSRQDSPRVRLFVDFLATHLLPGGGEG